MHKGRMRRVMNSYKDMLCRWLVLALLEGEDKRGRREGRRTCVGTDVQRGQS